MAQPNDGQWRGSDEETIYLASNTRKKFHRPNCEWARYIPVYKLIEFGSHREACEAGYKPCGTCRA
jgi:micrococcal nuclease